MAFSFIDPLGVTKFEKTEALSPALSPGESREINFTCNSRQGETLGIWGLDCVLENETDVVYSMYDARKVAVGKYVTSGNGYSNTPDITYSVSSTNDHFAYGSDAVFTVTVWNRGKSNRTVSLKYCFPHHGWIEYAPQYGIDKNDRSWYNLEETNIVVPAEGSASFIHKLENVRTYDRFWSNLYDENGKMIGSSSLGIYCFQPGLEIDFESPGFCKVNTNTTLNFTITEEKGDITGARIAVKLFDSEFRLLEQNRTTEDILSGAPYSGSLEFRPEKAGTYNLVVEVTKGDKRLGTDSLYLIAKDRMVNLWLPEEEQTFRFNATNTVNLSVENLEETNASNLVLETLYTGPDGAVFYSGSTALPLEAGEFRETGVVIPFGDASFGRHIISFRVLDGAEVLESKELYFDYTPEFQAYLSTRILVKGCNETLTLSLTNGNAEGELTVNVSSPENLGFQNTSTVYLEAGERKALEYLIPVKKDPSVGVLSIKISTNESEKASAYTTLTKSLNYRAGNSKLTTIAPSNVRAGENLTFNITNEGPFDTSGASYTLYFLGTSMRGNAPILNGETISVELPVPLINSGDYSLRGDLYNQGTGRKSYIYLPVHVEGIELELSAGSKLLRADGTLPVVLNNSGVGITADVKAIFSKGWNRWEFSEQNVSVGAGQEKTLEISLSPDLPSGVYYLYLECRNTSLGLDSHGYYNVEVEGLELSFEVPGLEYVAGENLYLGLNNTGGIDTLSNITLSLDNTELDKKQAVTAAGQKSSLTFKLPETLHSGTHNLYVVCKEEKSGRTLTYSKTIQVKGIEYELEMETQSAKPGEIIKATINNTGSVVLSGSYYLELFEGNIVKANTSGNVVSLISGNTETLSLEVPNLNSGTYQLTLKFEDQGGEEKSKSVSIYVPDPSFDLSLNRTEYRQGDTIGAVLGNISGITNGSFSLNLFDEQSNKVASSRVDKIVSSGSVELELGIPEGLFSGSYVLFVDAKDLNSGLGNSTSTVIPVEGVSLTSEIRVEKTEYLENDTINYTALFHCTGELPGGNASIRTYLRESSAASRDFTLYSKYPVSSVVRLGDRVFLGTNGGLYEDTGNGEVEPVDNTKLASMKVSSLDTSGGLLWVLNEYTVYSYNPAIDELIEVLVVEKEEEFYGYQEEGPEAGTIKVDAVGQKVYLVNWNDVKEYNFGEGSPAATYNSTNSPISDNSILDDVLVLPNELLFIAYYWDYSTWPGVRYSECYSLSASGWNQYNSSSGLPSDNVLAVVSDESYVYFITDAGISRRAAAGGSISTLYEFKEEESPSMVDTANAFNGVVLLYSDRKLYRYTASGTLDIFTIFEDRTDLSGLAQGSSAVWLYGYNGLFAFNETGDPGIRQVPINSFRASEIVAGDSTCIVSTSGKFLSIYEVRSGLWTEMEVRAASGISAATLTSGYIWLASGEDLFCIDKNTKEISIFNASNSGYEESGSLRLESHNEDLWVLSDSGLSVYGTSGGISSTALNVPVVRSPKAFTASGDLVAIIDSSGVIHEYDYGLNTVRHYGTGVYGGYSYELAYSGGVYWILHNNGLFSYDPEFGILEQYDGNQNFYSLVSTEDALYALCSGEYMGSKVHFFDGEAWKELTTGLVPENSWISGMERGQGTVLLYDSDNGWIGSFNGKKAQLVLDEPVNLDNFSGDGTAFSWTGSYVAEKEGQLTFELSAVTDYNQLTDFESSSVDVYARDFSFAIATDKGYYRPDESFNVKGLVSNNAPVPLLSELVLLGDGTEFKRISLDVAPSETESFELSAPDFALGTHTLTARIGSTVVNREITVETPQVQVNLTAPELVDSKPFIIGLTATNPGNVTAEVELETDNLSLETSNFTFSLAPGTSRAFEFNATIRKNTTIDFNVTGDLTEHLTKFVEFGEKASIASESLVLYRPGKVEIPLNISNTGKYNTKFTATFAVNETLNETRTYRLGVNQSINDTLVFTLGKGTYSFEAAADIPLEFVEWPFTVNRTVSLNLSELKMLSGNLSVCANVSNLHPQLPFNGTLEISADFFEQAYVVNLTALENSSLEYRIPLLDLPAGNYSVDLELLEAGVVLERANSSFTIVAPEFGLLADPANKGTADLGETLRYNFTVNNTGSVGGEATVKLDIPGIYESSRTGWVGSGEAEVFSFDFIAPDDLEEKYYSVYYGLEGEEQEETEFYLQGANITVSSWLDMRAYLPGETATLTLEVKNNGLHALDLYSRVKYPGFENVTEFSTGAGATSRFTVDIPVSETEEKVFISVYMDTPEGGADSGRSLYINSDYIHDRRDINGLRISTEKQAYASGETVKMYANISRSDRLTIEGPGLLPSYNETISQNSTVSFTMPYLPSGVYRYDITYGNASGTYLLDVHGLDLVVLAADIGTGDE